MTIDEKRIAYSKIGIRYIGIGGSSFFKIVSLLCRLTIAIRKEKNDNTISSLQVLDIFYKARNEYEKEICENLSVHCDFQLGIEFVEFDDYGMKTAKEIQREIVNILSGYLPF